MVTNSVVVPFAAGQSERLTTRLRGLIRSYPLGPGIVKEFMQNADDAGANSLHVIMDWRDRTESVEETSPLRPMLGPALLLSNDSVFSDQDFQRIQTIGDSGKQVDTSKTGRFGLGFNTAYNVTDFPSFISRDRLLCFDPHTSTAQALGAQPGWTGVGFKLDALAAGHPAWLDGFSVAGLVSGVREFEGTVFRLPLRDTARAAVSEISDKPFDEGVFTAVLDAIGLEAADMLLFTRSLLNLTISEVSPHGAHRDLLEVRTSNPSDVQESRSRVQAYYEAHYNSDATPQDARVLPYGSSHRHIFQVSTPGGPEEQNWQVAIGYFPDPAGELLRQSATLRTFREKAVPEAGVALKLLNNSQVYSAAPIAGRIFCTLPLAVESGLPAHVHGFFDLDSARTGLTSDETAISGAQARTTWNRLLFQHAVPQAYILAMSAVPGEWRSADMDAYYSLWPSLEHIKEPLARASGVAIHRSLADAPMMRGQSSEGLVWTTLKGISQISEPWYESLAEPLVADGFCLANPLLPRHVVDGVVQAGHKVSYITPKVLKKRWRTPGRKDGPLGEAPHPALRRRDWLEQMTRYLLTDEPEDLHGLPIALLANGELATFGFAISGSTFVAGELERRILPYSHWFIDPDFQRVVNFVPSAKAKLFAMEPKHVLSNLPKILKVDNGESHCTWDPAGDELPNARWLREVLLYLAENAASLHQDSVNALPLVPDQFNRLVVPKHKETPLFRPQEDSGARLTNALEQARIPLVSGDSELVSAVHRIADAFEYPFVSHAVAKDIADSLVAYADRWSEQAERYAPALHDPVLDCLSIGLTELTREQLEELKELALVPTLNETLVPATTPQLFRPSVERPPPQCAVNAILAATGPHGIWAHLFAALDVPELDLNRTVFDVVLPATPNLDRKGQVEVARYVRAVRQRLLEDAESEEKRQLLRKQLSEAEFIIGDDGRLHSPARLYLPGADTGGLLEGIAVHPDLSAYGPPETNLWHEFFKNLNLASRPRPADLVAQIDRIATSGFPTVETRGNALRLFWYLQDNWDSVKDTNVTFGAAEGQVRARRRFADILKERAWLPALADDPGTFPGFVAPDARFYKLSEMYPRSNGHLVASQRPIFVSDPAKSIQAELGMASQPALEIVLEHFDYLLERRDDSGPQSFSDEAFGKSLDQIYRRIGASCRDPISSESIIEDLHERYEDTPCLWDHSRRRLLRPCDGFAERVPFFSPLKLYVDRSDPVMRVGLDALGRRQRPEFSDFINYLELLAEEKGNTPCDENEIRCVLYVLARIGDDRDHPVPSDLNVLTEAGTLVSLDECLWDDATYLRERIDRSRLTLVHNQVHARILLASRRLSEAIIERLLDEPKPSDNNDIHTICHQVRKLWQSREFQEGLDRLIFNAHGDLALKDRPKLPPFYVEAATSLHTELLVETRSVGSGNVYVFADNYAEIIWIATATTDVVWFELAQVVNRMLGSYQLPDLSSLERMLELSPDRIPAALDARRVPRLPHGATDSLTDDFSDFEESGETGADLHEQSNVDPELQSEENADAGPDPGAETQDSPTQKIEEDAASQRHLPITAVTPKHGEKSNGSAASFASERSNEGKTGQLTGASGSITSEASPDASDDRPPTTPGNGMRARPQSDVPSGDIRVGTNVGGANRRRGRFISYVLPVTGDDQETSNDDVADLVGHNDEVAQAAVVKVLAFEQEHGRNANEMPPRNPGYDVVSTDSTGVVRYIEVKGIDGEWDAAGVGLSRRQFLFAMERGSEAWLYVVENARIPGAARIYAIQNPAQSVNLFCFDQGWRHAAEPLKQRPGLPKAGNSIVLESGELVTVLDVEQRGSFTQLNVRSFDGATRLIIWRAGTHLVLEREVSNGSHDSSPN